MAATFSAMVEATARDLLMYTAGPYAKEIFAPLRKDILQETLAIQRETGKEVITREDVGMAIGRALHNRIAS